jgi:hypothetical protein
MRSGNGSKPFKMKSEDLYTAAFLAVLPVCLERAYHNTKTGENGLAALAAVDEAHRVAVDAREKWLIEKEKTRRRGGLPNK